MRLLILFLCCFSSISYPKECSVSDVIEKENAFLLDALTQIVKYDPKVNDRLNLINLYVFGTHLYLPHRYRISHLEDGLRLSTDIRGRLKLYGCNVTEELRLNFGGKINIGKRQACLLCIHEVPNEEGITVVEKQISSEIKLRLITLDDLDATVVYILKGDMYIEVLDSNQELHKYILFQLNGYK